MEFDWKYKVLLQFLWITFPSKLSMSKSNMGAYSSEAVENLSVWKLCFASFRLDSRYGVNKQKAIPTQVQMLKQPEP